MLSYRGRVDIRGEVSESTVQEIVNDPTVKVIQADNPVNTETWKLLNDHLIPKRPDILIRIFAHYLQVCDLSFLNQIPSVEKLSIEVRDSRGFEYVTQLQALKSLSVCIYDIESFDFLESLPQSVEKLGLGATKSKKPRLEGLLNLPNLKELHIERQIRNIEVIGELELLEKLSLRSVSPKEIDFLRKLEKLWSLEIRLGGIKDLSALEALNNIKYLEIWLVRGLADISVISSLIGLQFLFLQALRNVDRVPDLSKLVNLRKIILDTMNGLDNLDGLFKAPAIEEFLHVAANNLTPAHYEPLLELSTLKKVGIGFGSEHKNNQMKEMIQMKGIDLYSYEPFVFDHS